jgi:hypothetical protein
MKEQLPAFILAELFSNSLVDTGDIAFKPSQVKEEVQKPANWYLGNNERKFVVLVNEENNIYLNNEDLDFLTGILNACKLNLAHIALINFHNHAVNFQRLKKELQCGFLLSFGVKALEIELPFTMPDYQVQQYNNCQIITAPALAELNKQTAPAKTEKTKLWGSLKRMLNI